MISPQRQAAKHLHGYSLVEVLIAITILLLAVAGPLTIASKGLQSSYYARDQVVANMLAQEGIEAVLSIRNQAVLAELNSGSPDFSASNLWNWTGSISSCFAANGCNIDVVDSDPSNDVTGCNGSGSNCVLRYNSGATRGQYSLSGGDITPFKRVVRLVETVNDQEVTITSTVSWQPSVFNGTERSVVLTTSIFNYYATP